MCVRARADSPVLEGEEGRDSGRRGVRIRRALANRSSNQLVCGFCIHQLVAKEVDSLPTIRRRKAGKLGAQALMPPMDLPTVGRIAGLQERPDKQPGPSRAAQRAGFHAIRLLAALPYHIPERVKAIAQPAVKRIRNGEGSMNQATTAAPADRPAQR